MKGFTMGIMVAALGFATLLSGAALWTNAGRLPENRQVIRDGLAQQCAEEQNVAPSILRVSRCQ